MDILEAKADLSVPLNGVYLPFKDVPRACARFAQPMVLHNEASDYEVSIVGSCGRIRYMGQNFILATKHQLRDGLGTRPITDVCVVTRSGMDTGVKLTTPNGARLLTFNDPHMAFAEDVLMATFTTNGPVVEFNTNFLNISESPDVGDKDIENILGYFTIGFPSDATKYLLDSAQTKIAEVVSGFYIFELLESDSILEKHLSFRARRPLPDGQSYDGFSGAPVFFISKHSSDDYRCGFAGVVRAAANGIFHAYDAREIKQYIRAS